MPKLQREFQLACAAWSESLGIKLNALFNLMPNYGRSVHWMRERYYGGTFVEDVDIEWVRAAQVGEDATLPVDRMRLYVTAIERMCNYCAGADETKTPTCWDAACPLRPVSPLPLKVQKLCATIPWRPRALWRCGLPPCRWCPPIGRVYFGAA